MHTHICTPHICTHIQKKNMASRTPLWGCCSTAHGTSLGLKEIMPGPTKLSRMSSALRFLLHFLVVQKVGRRRRACLTRPRLFCLYFSPRASSRFMDELSQVCIVTWLLRYMFGSTSSFNILGCLPENDNGWGRTAGDGNEVPFGESLPSDCGALFPHACIYI